MALNSLILIYFLRVDRKFSIKVLITVRYIKANSFLSNKPLMFSLEKKNYIYFLTGFSHEIISRSIFSS